MEPLRDEVEHVILLDPEKSKTPNPLKKLLWSPYTKNILIATLWSESNLPTNYIALVEFLKKNFDIFA